MLEMLSNEYVSIVVNCAKTALRVFEKTEDLKTKIDYSPKQIQDSIDGILQRKPCFTDYTVLRSVCVFCVIYGGLDSLGLIYSNQEIESAIVEIDRVNH